MVERKGGRGLDGDFFNTLLLFLFLFFLYSPFKNASVPIQSGCFNNSGDIRLFQPLHTFKEQQWAAM